MKVKLATTYEDLTFPHFSGLVAKGIAQGMRGGTVQHHFNGFKLIILVLTLLLYKARLRGNFSGKSFKARAHGSGYRPIREGEIYRRVTFRVVKQTHSSVPSSAPESALTSALRR